MDGESNGKVGGELLDQLFSAFEDLETQSAGILQFLKGKGLATDEELAPYLQQAADASNVRWLAARLRMDALLAAAIKDAEEEFARKMEERARAHDESAAQKPEELGKVRENAATHENIDKHKADGAKEAEAPITVAAADAAKDKKEATEAKKEEVETSSEVSAAKEGPASENKRSEAANDSTNQNAA